MKTYIVKLDIAFLDEHEIEAETKDQAIQIAERESDYRGSIAGVFEVEEVLE